MNVFESKSDGREVSSIHRIEGKPVGLGGPSISRRTIAGVLGVRVRAGALANTVVDASDSQCADAHHCVGGTGGQLLSLLDLQGPSSQRSGGGDAGKGADSKVL